MRNGFIRTLLSSAKRSSSLLSAACWGSNTYWPQPNETLKQQDTDYLLSQKFHSALHPHTTSLESKKAGKHSQERPSQNLKSQRRLSPSSQTITVIRHNKRQTISKDSSSFFNSSFLLPTARSCSSVHLPKQRTYKNSFSFKYPFWRQPDRLPRLLNAALHTCFYFTPELFMC